MWEELAIVFGIIGLLFLVGIALGRVVPVFGGEATGALAQALAIFFGLATAFSILDLIGIGILTVWPNAFLFGLMLVWSRRCNRRRRGIG